MHRKVAPPGSQFLPFLLAFYSGGICTFTTRHSIRSNQTISAALAPPPLPTISMLLVILLDPSAIPPPGTQHAALETGPQHTGRQYPSISSRTSSGKRASCSGDSHVGWNPDACRAAGGDEGGGRRPAPNTSLIPARASPGAPASSGRPRASRRGGGPRPWGGGGGGSPPSAGRCA